MLTFWRVEDTDVNSNRQISIPIWFAQRFSTKGLFVSRKREEEGRWEENNGWRVEEVLPLFCFWCLIGEERKKEERGKKRKIKRKNPTTDSLSPLPYLYLTLILGLRCFFRRFLRERDSFLLPSDWMPARGRELSSFRKQIGEEKKNPLFLPLPLKCCKTNVALKVFCYFHFQACNFVSFGNYDRGVVG